ncbi:G-type lectin S-receptor-like serine/threonine-protein kinase SD3-1 [Rutidosis leptorrhynchoides]|uniref:G-type lectin S-receptor-like serine/threonine-protein kinase SD3-1 n=1 Tax=Rutidosis leptorrhynchoides TaxID=125765 RepID=UPI003A9A3FC1
MALSFRVTCSLSLFLLKMLESLFIQIPFKNLKGFSYDSDRNVGYNDKAKNLVSENGVFEFGFLETDGGEFVVGIRYNLGPTKSANLPVWTVGGGVRVSISSTFKLSMDGKLVLFENPSNSILWSSDTSNLGVEKVTLLDNGNLVLMGSDDRIIWESFDRPTNTLLPGQTLSYPRNLRAPSTKSVTSYYTFVINQDGLALMWESNISYWRTYLSSSSAVVKEVRFDPNGVLGLYDDTQKIIWSVSSKDLDESSVSFRHVRMDQDGNLRIYSWDNVVRSWKVGWQAVEDQCSVFGSCGLYSVCGYNSTGPICGCLYSDPLDFTNGFGSPESGGSGCKKMVDLSNCKAHTSMTVMKQTVLYGLYPPHDIDMMLNEEDCKAYCSNDTTCLALTSKNDGSGLCKLKRTAYISGSTSPTIPSTSFLKVCLVPQAVAAKGANPNVTPKAVSFPFRGNYKKIISAVAFVVLVTVMGILVLETFIVLFVYHKKRNISRNSALKGAKTNIQNNTLIRLSYKEIHELTSGFSTQLGFFVFKGLLLDELVVAAKVLDVTVLTEKEFIKAVSILGGTHHRNIVSLKGFCFEPKHKVLLYEFIPNGSVDKWLFDDKEEKSWQQRVDIGIGVTRALAYLHTECQLCIPHGNLKLENVLLDDTLVPKVTDFGIQSFLKGDGSCSSSNESPSEKDIYMLGKMLIEIVLISRDTVNDSLDLVMERVTKEQQYLNSDDLRGVERVVRIALWCMQNQSFLRPSVGEVLKVLEGTLSVDRPPSSFVYRDVDDNEKKVVEEIEQEIKPGS